MATPVYIVAGQSNAYTLNGGNGGASLAQAYADLTGSTDVRVAAVSASGAPLTWGREGEDWYNQTELFDQLVAAITQALAEPGTYLASVVWIQGEGDTYDFARATEYAARLTALVHRLEDRLAPMGAQTDDFRFSVLSLASDCPTGAARANWSVIRQQQLGLTDPRIDVIDADRATAGQGGGGKLFQDDGLHYAATANAAVLAALLDRTPLQLDGTMANDILRGLSGYDTLRGGDGHDRLTGGGGSDYLRAWTGNDSLFGGSGADTILGDAGADQIFGGWGGDQFVYNTPADLGAPDTIWDFKPGVDKLVLTTLDANTLAAGNQAFRFLGSAAFDGSAAALRLQAAGSGTWVQMDTNGDRVADMSLYLAYVAPPTAADFLL